MLPHPDTVYRIHQLRHQERIATAERAWLINQAKDDHSRPMRARMGFARRLAVLVAASFRRVTVRREYARFESWR